MVARKKALLLALPAALIVASGGFFHFSAGGVEPLHPAFGSGVITLELPFQRLTGGGGWFWRIAGWAALIVSGTMLFSSWRARSWYWLALFATLPAVYPILFYEGLVLEGAMLGLLLLAVRRDSSGQVGAVSFAAALPYGSVLVSLLGGALGRGRTRVIAPVAGGLALVVRWLAGVPPERVAAKSVIEVLAPVGDAVLSMGGRLPFQPLAGPESPLEMSDRFLIAALPALLILAGRAIAFVREGGEYPLRPIGLLILSALSASYWVTFLMESWAWAVARLEALSGPEKSHRVRIGVMIGMAVLVVAGVRMTVLESRHWSALTGTAEQDIASIGFLTERPLFSCDYRTAMTVQGSAYSRLSAFHLPGWGTADAPPSPFVLFDLSDTEAGIAALVRQVNERDGLLVCLAGRGSRSKMDPYLFAGGFREVFSGEVLRAYVAY